MYVELGRGDEDDDDADARCAGAAHRQQRRSQIRSLETLCRVYADNYRPLKTGAARDKGLEGKRVIWDRVVVAVPNNFPCGNVCVCV